MASGMNPASPRHQREVDAVKEVLNSNKSPRSCQNQGTSQHKELCNLTMANEKLTKEKQALLKELQDLKVEMAQQESQNLLARRKHSNDVLEVLSTELTCAICSDIIIEATAIECGHIFCSFCISAWLSYQKNANSCPTCRATTYRDPIKISKLSSAIASFHMLLSQEAQFDRRQALEDRNAELKRIEEASACELYWFQNLSRAHELVTESVRNYRPLSPGIHDALEEDSTAHDHPTDVEAQADLDSLPASSSRLPIGYHSDHLNIHVPFLEDSLTFIPEVYHYQSSDADDTENPERITPLPMLFSPTNNQGQAAFVPFLSSIGLSTPRQAPEVTNSDDEVIDINLARLQQGALSISHQFYMHEPSLRRRSY